MAVCRINSSLSGSIKDKTIKSKIIGASDVNKAIERLTEEITKQSEDREARLKFQLTKDSTIMRVFIQNSSGELTKVDVTKYKGLQKDLQKVNKYLFNQLWHLVPSRTENSSEFENLNSLTPKDILKLAEKVKAQAPAIQKTWIEEKLSNEDFARICNRAFGFGDFNGILRNIFQIPLDFLTTFGDILNKLNPILAPILTIGLLFTPLGVAHSIFLIASAIYLIQRTGLRVVQGSVNMPRGLKNLILGSIAFFRALDEYIKTDNKNIKKEKWNEFWKLFFGKFFTNIINVGEASFWLTLGILCFIAHAHPASAILAYEITILTDILFGGLFVLDGFFSVINSWRDYRKVERYKTLINAVIDNIDDADIKMKNQAIIKCLKDKILPSKEKLYNKLEGFGDNEKWEEFARIHQRKEKNKIDYLNGIIGEEITKAIVDEINANEENFNVIIDNIKTNIANSIKIDEYKERFVKDKEAVKSELKELFGKKIADVIIAGLEKDTSKDEIIKAIKNVDLDLDELISKKIERVENRNLDCGFGGFLCLLGCAVGFASMEPITADRVWLDLSLDIFWVYANYVFFKHCDRLEDKDNGHSHFGKDFTRGLYKALDWAWDNTKKATIGSNKLFQATFPKSPKTEVAKLDEGDNGSEWSA